VSASTLLRTARHGAGLTQRDLATRSHKAQSAIARLESGRVVPRSGLLSELVTACRWTLAVLPTLRSPVAEHSAEIADRLASGQERHAYRAVIQLADDLAAEHGAERVALAVTPPGTTGDARYDALIAGVTEYRLVEEALPLPRWLTESDVVLGTQWFVDPYSQGDADTVAATPEPLRRRNVVIDASELESV
jgi:transcriptional regulator with XRE-family HTH domain